MENLFEKNAKVSGSVDVDPRPGDIKTLSRERARMYIFPRFYRSVVDTRRFRQTGTADVRSHLSVGEERKKGEKDGI